MFHVREFSNWKKSGPLCIYSIDYIILWSHSRSILWDAGSPPPDYIMRYTGSPDYIMRYTGSPDYIMRLYRFPQIILWDIQVPPDYIMRYSGSPDRLNYDIYTIQ